MSRHAEVIVVGAGLAGLEAAARLRAAGRDVLVLEARERVGGRTWSVPVGGATVDFGAQWTGPGQPRMAARITGLDLETRPTFTEGRKVLDRRGRVSTYRGTIPRIAPWKLVEAQLSMWRVEAACRRVPKEAPWRAAGAESLDGQTALTWVGSRVWSEDVVDLVNAATRVIFGSELGELSALHFLHYLHSGGGLQKLVDSHGGNQDARVVGGAQRIAEGLAGLAGEVVLGAPVRRIDQDPQGVDVHADDRSFRARRVVVAVPIALAGRIRYSPALPTLRDQLVQRVGMGGTVKVFARYDRAFWREGGLSGEGVGTRGTVNVAFDDEGPAGQPGLVAFVTGRAARGWAERPVAERREEVLATLARWFGPEATHPTDYAEADWAREPYSGGAPIATFPPGSLSAMGPALRAPVGRIHWAGTETALESSGFMEGALESGERAAAEVLATEWGGEVLRPTG
ncbi:FAD-dependent oxidoreductase [Myxococcota bacterium]|nr:FAD-dependent oxidoreductase [Myxococcota bacterium]